MPDDAPQRTLGEVLRDARVAKDLKLRELARRLQIAPSYLSDIENDRRIPSEELIQPMAQQLDLSFDELMAMAGRLGETAEQYVRRHPAAGVLLRKASEAGLSDRELRRMIEDIEKRQRGETEE